MDGDVPADAWATNSRVCAGSPKPPAVGPEAPMYAWATQVRGLAASASAFPKAVCMCSQAGLQALAWSVGAGWRMARVCLGLAAVRRQLCTRAAWQPQARSGAQTCSSPHAQRSCLELTRVFPLHRCCSKTLACLCTSRGTRGGTTW